MNTIWILIMLNATSVDRVQTAYIDRYTTSTACERAHAALISGVDQTSQQKKLYACVPYEVGK